MFVKVAKDSVLAERHDRLPLHSRLSGGFFVKEEVYQKFLKEADTSCPHLSAEQKHAWAAYSAHQHPGIRLTKKVGSFIPRFETIAQIAKIVLLLLIFLLLLSFRVKAEPHRNIVISAASEYGRFIVIVPSDLFAQEITPLATQRVNIFQIAGTAPSMTGSSLNVNCTGGCAGGGGSSNITQFGGNNVVTGTGASGLGIPRVTVSNDSNILATQSGSWTVTTTPPANASTNVVQWANSNLGAMANYGTSPGAVLVPGVNAFVTNTVTVSGTITANAGTNLNTSALLLDATFTGRINTQGQKTSAASTPVVIASDQSAVPVSGTVTTTPPANASTNVTQVAGVSLGSTAVTNYGTAPAAAAVPGVNAFVTNTVGVSGTVTTTPPANASTNVAQFGGNNVVTGTGVGGNGIPRVTVSSDSFPATQAVSGTVSVTNFANPLPVSQSGTWADTVTQASGANLHANIDNFPATQPVSGTVAVSNFPATQPISGTVTTVPANPTQVQNVKVTNTPFNPLPVSVLTPMYVAVNVNGTITLVQVVEGQTTMSNSLPVVLASDQTPLTVKTHAVTGQGADGQAHVLATDGAGNMFFVPLGLPRQPCNAVRKTNCQP
jgi:hypothetical protein